MTRKMWFLVLFALVSASTVPATNAIAQSQSPATQSWLTLSSGSESARLEPNGAITSQGFVQHFAGRLNLCAGTLCVYGNADFSIPLEASNSRFVEFCRRDFWFPDCGRPPFDPGMEFKGSGGVQFSSKFENAAVESLNWKIGGVWWNSEHLIPANHWLGIGPQKLGGAESEVNAVFYKPSETNGFGWSAIPFVSALYLQSFDPNDGTLAIGDYPTPLPQTHPPVRPRVWNNQNALYVQAGVRGEFNFELAERNMRGINIGWEEHAMFDNGSFGYDKGLLDYAQLTPSYYVNAGHLTLEGGAQFKYSRSITGRQYDYRDGYSPYYDYGLSNQPLLWRPPLQQSITFFLTTRIRM